jgi:hypothetical protein
MNIVTPEVLIVIINVIALFVMNIWHPRRTKFEKAFYELRDTLQPFIKQYSTENMIENHIRLVSAAFIESHPKLRSDYHTLIMQGRDSAITLSKGIIKMMYSGQSIPKKVIEKEVSALFDLLKVPVKSLGSDSIVAALQANNQFHTEIHVFEARVHEIISGKYNGKSVEMLQTIMGDFVMTCSNFFVDSIYQQNEKSKY